MSIEKHRSASSKPPEDRQRRRFLGVLAAGAGVSALGGLPWTRTFATSTTSGATMVSIIAFNRQGERAGPRELPKVTRTTAEWKDQLSPLAYRVTRKRGTERAFSGDYSKPEQAGIYRCICCDTALYDAATQFHSGTGWPSFWQPIAEQNIAQHSDDRLGMRRTEILCKRCDAHLGHVFQDGPEPTGLRYCMNSAALHFDPNRQA